MEQLQGCKIYGLFNLIHDLMKIIKNSMSCKMESFFLEIQVENHQVYLSVSPTEPLSLYPLVWCIFLLGSMILVPANQIKNEQVLFICHSYARLKQAYLLQSALNHVNNGFFKCCPVLAGNISKFNGNGLCFLFVFFVSFSQQFFNLSYFHSLNNKALLHFSDTESEMCQSG